jgi:hypothetical protein
VSSPTAALHLPHPFLLNPDISSFPHPFPWLHGSAGCTPEPRRQISPSARAAAGPSLPARVSESRGGKRKEKMMTSSACYYLCRSLVRAPPLKSRSAVRFPSAAPPGASGATSTSKVNPQLLPVCFVRPIYACTHQHRDMYRPARFSWNSILQFGTCSHSQK